MRVFMLAVAIAVVLAAPAHADGGQSLKPWNAPWDEGADNCAQRAHKPLEIRRYDEGTYVLRENLCATWEAPFMYLLIGEKKALLIDTGDVAEPQKMPLAQTVAGLVTQHGALPLLVVHTHRHLDHRAGDPQFANRNNVVVVGYDLDSVRRFYGFHDWPNGVAHLDLGNRIVDVMPTPGHNETHVVFYDRKTSLLFSGDFMLPGRMLVDDPAAEAESARRVADFIRSRPVAAVLGGHVEMNSAGELFDWESTWHPHEHALAMKKEDLLALPQAFQSFNGFYSESGKFTFIDSMRNLLAVGAGAILLLLGVAYGLIRLFRRRRSNKLQSQRSPVSTGSG